MGYSTDFNGRFRLNKRLGPKMHEYLNRFSASRRMKRFMDKKYGIEGEFYAPNTYSDNNGIINHNQPPSTQPSLNLGWVPTRDGMYIEWDGTEKFYEYIPWIVYLINKILKPNGYVLNGVVEYYGEDSSDIGAIVITDNNVTELTGIIVKEIDAISAKIYDFNERQYINNFIKPDVVYIINEDE